ncbi:MAG: N-acetylglucosamine-6-phosphate deacetylase [Planctomycetota bacterium]|nr:N-acetylglucosamine-6-phosphate deacetylase [Planctomycetota bacterium]
MALDERGYFDIQINGYKGVDFHKDDLSGEELRGVCEALNADGNDGILLTITTEKLEFMTARLARVAKLRAQDKRLQSMIWGIHVEGPFLNERPGYKGAHPEDAIHPANVEEMKRLLDAADGLVRLVTLAPERDPGFATTKYLHGKGVVVSAGHCDPSLDELKAAIDAGVSMFTHLGNGCPMQMHRHDNIVQRALSLYKHLWLCFIPDGAHVAFPALGNYLRAAGFERTIVVTDAIAAAGMGPGTYKLGRWTLTLGEDMVARAPDGSHLVGAAITMPQCEKNLVEKVGLSREDARRLLVANPRIAFGLD